MDPHDIRDLRRAILKYQRANILDDAGSGQSTDAPRTEASECGPSVLDVFKYLIFIEEQV